MADNKKRYKDKVKTRKRISKYVKQMRKLDELRQEDIADEIFVTRKAISKWETKKSSPSVDSINELSKAYNVSFEEIVNGHKVPEVRISKVLLTIFKNPWVKISIFFVICFLMFIISNIYNNSKYYYFDYKTNNYVITKGKIYTLRKNLKIDIPKINNKNNLNLTFKMDLFNKRVTIYKCTYINKKCITSYVREGISNRMIKRNNIYLYIKEDEEYVLNKINVYKPSYKKKKNKRLNYCILTNCNYHYGIDIKS